VQSRGTVETQNSSPALLPYCLTRLLFPIYPDSLEHQCITPPRGCALVQSCTTVQYTLADAYLFSPGETCDLFGLLLSSFSSLRILPLGTSESTIHNRGMNYPYPC
jgi:hypothetical protein